MLIQHKRGTSYSSDTSASGSLSFPQAGKKLIEHEKRRQRCRKIIDLLDQNRELLVSKPHYLYETVGFGSVPHTHLQGAVGCFKISLRLLNKSVPHYADCDGKMFSNDRPLALPFRLLFSVIHGATSLGLLSAYPIMFAFEKLPFESRKTAVEFKRLAGIIAFTEGPREAREKKFDEIKAGLIKRLDTLKTEA